MSRLLAIALLILVSGSPGLYAQSTAVDREKGVTENRVAPLLDVEDAERMIHRLENGLFRTSGVVADVNYWAVTPESLFASRNLPSIIERMESTSGLAVSEEDLFQHVLFGRGSKPCFSQDVRLLDNYLRLSGYVDPN